MKRVQVQLEPDCHKILKCVCAHMGITMSEFYIRAGCDLMSEAFKTDKQLKQLIESIPLTPGSRAYKQIEQIQLDASP